MQSENVLQFPRVLLETAPSELLLSILMFLSECKGSPKEEEQAVPASIPFVPSL